jgi:hypothetical protein
MSAVIDPAGRKTAAIRPKESRPSLINPQKGTLEIPHLALAFIYLPSGVRTPPQLSRT